MGLSAAQEKVMRFVYLGPNNSAQVAGNKMIGKLTSARALARMGFLVEWKTSTFSVTGEGKSYIERNFPELKEKYESRFTK